MREPIYTRTVGNAVIKVYEDLTDINDSLLLESDTTLIATYEDRTKELYVAYTVRGEVKIGYKGNTYRYPQDFPDELTEMIRNGTLYDSEDVYIDFNNWFCGEQWSAPFDEIRDFIFDDVVDIENMSPKEIADDIEAWANEIGEAV